MGNSSNSSASGMPSEGTKPTSAQTELVQTELVQTELATGLAALKRKDYSAAIAPLEAVCQTATDVMTLSKAQMGLVKAYAQTGGVKAAIALCRSLVAHPNSRVSAWATRTLKDLVLKDLVLKDPAQKNSAHRSAVSSQPFVQTSLVDATGFDATGFDATGFVPFGSNSGSQPAIPADATGFTPLETSKRSTHSPRLREVRQNQDDEKEDLAASLSSCDRVNFEETAIFSSEDLAKREGLETQAEPIVANDSQPQLEQPHLEEREKRQPDLPNQPEQSSPISDRPSRSQHSPPQTNRRSSATVSRPQTIASIPWRQAGRAQKWTSLGKVDDSKLWGVQLLTVGLLVGVGLMLVRLSQWMVNGILFFLSWIPFLRSVRWSGDPTGWVVIALAVLVLVSPWFLNWILKRSYGLKPLSLDVLAVHSPEAVRLLKRVCHQKRRSIPKLGILVTSVPLIFTYGYLPQNTKIIVSQGLIDRLNDDELATLYAAELGHITSYAAGLLAGITLVIYLPYWLYEAVANWGNRQSDWVLQSLAVLVSSIAYGIYWVVRWAGVWLSRVRLYYGDRAATERTGNPNGVIRALLKTTIGIAQEIHQQTQTHSLLESMDLLLPVGHHSALTLGSVYPHAPSPQLLNWDTSHRYRQWLGVNQSHPPLGDRLRLLSLYAQHWRLEPELELGGKFEADKAQNQDKTQNRDIIQPSFTMLLLQGSPFFGGMVGIWIAGCIWLMGWLAYLNRWSLLDWLWFDRRIILASCILLGVGIGLLLRMNSMYPDLTRSVNNPDLGEYLKHPTTMPIDPMPVRMQGYLLGREKFLNRFYQDFILQTPTGLIRLHYTSKGGGIGNLCSQSRRPTELLASSAPVTVTGWLRRGATLWLDVDTIQTQKGSTFQSGHPTWSAIVAIGCALIGIYLLLRG
jgi:Zn-dependent protease with chaperone function